MSTTIEQARPRHLTVLISPTGEEFYEAYGPMTKDREKATLFFTNPLTLRAGPVCNSWFKVQAVGFRSRAPTDGKMRPNAERPPRLTHRNF